MDGLRLVFPPAGAAVICVPVCSTLPDLLISPHIINENFDLLLKILILEMFVLNLPF